MADPEDDDPIARRRGLFDNRRSAMDELEAEDRDRGGDLESSGAGLFQADPGTLKQLGLGALNVLGTVGRGASQATGLTGIKAALTGQNPLETLSGGQIGGAAAGAGIGALFGGIGAIPGALIGDIVGSIADPGKIRDVPTEQITGTKNILANLATDLALDPATYLTFGVKPLAEAGEKISQAAYEAAIKAGKTVDEATLAASSASKMAKMEGLGLRIPGTKPTFIVPGSRQAASAIERYADDLSSKLAKAIEGSALNPVKIQDRFLTREASSLRRALLDQAGKDVRVRAENEELFQRAINRGPTALQPVNAAGYTDLARLEGAAQTAGITDLGAMFSDPARIARAPGLSRSVSGVVNHIQEATRSIGQVFRLTKGSRAVFDLTTQAQRNYVFNHGRAVEEELTPLFSGLSAEESKLADKVVDQAAAVWNTIKSDFSEWNENVRTANKGLQNTEEFSLLTSEKLEELKNLELEKLNNAFESTIADVALRNPSVAQAATGLKNYYFKMWTLAHEAGVAGEASDFFVKHAVKYGDVAKLRGRPGGVLESISSSFAARTEEGKFGRWAFPTEEALKAAGYRLEENPIVKASMMTSAVMHAIERKDLFEKIANLWGRPITAFEREGVATLPRVKDLIDEQLGKTANIVPGGGAASLDQMVDIRKLRNVDVLGQPPVGQFVAIKDIPELASVRLPREIAQAVSDALGPSKANPLIGAMLRVYDVGNHLFKLASTSVFPAFHFRNEIGNLWNMGYRIGLRSLDPMQHLLVYDMLRPAKGGGYLKNDTLVDLGNGFRETYRDIRDAVLRRFGQSAGGKLDLDPEAFKGAAAAVNRFFMEGVPAGTRRLGPGALGSYIDLESKLHMYMSLRREGLDSATALDEVGKYLFDYGNLSKFEKNVMRRLIPFYTWQRLNLPLQLRTMLEKPVLATGYLSAWRDLNPHEQERAKLPTWLRDSIVVNMGQTPDGKLNLISNLDVPLRDAFTLVSSDGFHRVVEQKVLGQLSPLIRAFPYAGLEVATRHSFFQDREIAARAHTKGIESTFASIPGIREWLETKQEPDGRLSVDGVKLYGLEAFFLNRAVGIINRTSNPNVDPWWKVVDLMTGLAPRSVDLLQEQRARLMDLLRRYYESGEVRQSLDFGKPQTARAAIILQAKRQFDQAFRSPF